MNGDVPMMIEMQMISNMVTKEKFNELIDEGFQKASGGDISAYEERLNLYKDAWAAEKIESGSVMHLVYKPGTGMCCYLNKKLICTIPGLDFKQVYYGIWFCDEPCQQSLKDEMLGM